MEFEPSSWSAGSYLNVGVMWLWGDVDHVAFHLGHRVQGFQSYEDDEQFRPIADGLAKQAADVVTRFRDQFREVDDAARHYARETRDRRRAPVDDWHAGMSHALAGKPEDARRFLDRFASFEDERGWAVRMREDARGIATLANAGRMRRAVEGRIDSCRMKLRLPANERIVTDEP